MACCEEQLRLARESADKLQEANALCGLGILCSELGQSQRAIEQYQNAAALHEKIGDLSNRGNDLLHIAREMATLGLPDQETAYLREALLCFENVSDPRAEALRGRLGSRE